MHCWEECLKISFQFLLKEIIQKKLLKLLNILYHLLEGKNLI